MSTIQRVILDGFWTYGTQGVPYIVKSSGRSLGGYWRCRLGRPHARWTDQLRLDTGFVPANLWKQVEMRQPELAIHDDDDDELSCTNTAVLYIIQSFCSGTFKNLQLKWFQLLCVPVYNISNVETLVLFLPFVCGSKHTCLRHNFRETL